MKMRWPNEELMFEIEIYVKDHPGIWTAKLCRLMNGLPETEKSIIHCGQCRDYVNPRKRARAKLWAEIPTLPGLEPPYQIHQPCSQMQLRKLRYLLSVLEGQCDLVRSEPGAVIPDLRQARGWDYGTRYYPN